MFRFFYSIVWQLAEVLLLFAAYFSKKIHVGNKGRRITIESLAAWRKDLGSDAEVIWFHCASLGEFEQGRPVMEALKKQSPHVKIALTFFSPSGYEIRKNYSGADWIGYLPLDTYFNAKKIVRILNATSSFFVKYEFWTNYFLELKKFETRLFSISVILRDEQRFFQWYGFVWKPTLNAVSHFFVQNEKTQMLLQKIGFQNVSVSGDTRFDRVMEIAQSVKDLSWLTSFKGNDFLLVLGSSYLEEESLVSGLMKRWGNLKICIVPHETHPDRIQESKDCFESFGVVLLSSFQPKKNNEAHVLIVDSMGLLSSIYSQADAVVLGGGFGKGLHNSLEVAVYGVPMAFGGNHEKFQEALDLVNIGAAFPVENSDQLSSFIEHCRNHNDIPNAGKKYVEEHLGATSAILNGIEKYRL